MKNLAVIVSLAFLSSGTAVAQFEPEIPVETKWFKPLGVEEGLSQGDAEMILQDSLGFIWISTRDGLNRFDGYQVESFYSNPSDSMSLLDNHMYNMSLGNEGRLWVATYYGINLFDTYRGKFVRNYPFLVDSGGAFAVFVREDRSGNVWAVDISLQLYRIGIESGEVESLTPKPDDPRSIPHGVVTAAAVPPGSYESVFYEDESDHLWFGIGDTLVTYLGEQEGFVHRFVGKQPTVIGDDSSGMLWIGTAEGLVRMNPSTGSIETVWNHPESSPDDERTIFSLHVDRRDWVWFTTYESAHAVEAQSGDLIHSFRTPRSPGNHPLVLNQETENDIWFNQFNGNIFRYRYDDESFKQIVRDPKDEAGGVAQIFRDIYVDSGNTLWASGVNGTGAMYADLEFNQFSSIRLNDAGMTDANIRRMTVDGKGGVWVNTNVRFDRFDPSPNTSQPFSTWNSGGGAHGLFTDSRGDVWVAANRTKEIGHWQSSNEQMTTYQNGFGNSPGLGSGQPSIIKEDESGTIWIGTRDDGVYFFDRESGRFGSLPNKLDAPLSSPPVLAMTVDKSGDLWWSHPEVVYRRTATTGEIHEFRQFASGEPMGDVYTLVGDELGSMWMGVNDMGLGRITPENGVAERFEPEGVGDTFLRVAIRTMDSNGDLWALSPRRSGAIRINPRTGATDWFTVQNSDLPMNTISSIIPGPKNDVWISTNGQGLARIDLDSKEIRVFSTAEGLPSPEFNGHSGLLASNGYIYLGGPRGVTYFDPDDFSDNVRAPSIVLNSVNLFNEPIQHGPDSPLTQPAAIANTLRLSHSQNSLTFYYVGLHYSDPSSLTYEYVLDGYEEEWQHVGATRTATYPNLPFGDYTFRVRAVTASGIVSQNEAALSVLISPPWWRTWWAYVGYLVLIVLAGLSVHRVQTERTLRVERERTKDLELAQAEKVRVAHAELQKTHEKLKESQEQLIHSEKMASLGQLTAGIAHEIKNPLNFVTNFAEVNTELADELEEAIAGEKADDVASLLSDIKENTSQIARHGARADSIVKSMMQHASGAGPQKESVDINSFVGQQIDLAWHGRRARDHGFKAEFVREFDEDAASLDFFPQELGRVLINLLNNACDAVTGLEEPRVTISTKREKNQITISVSDNGPGIPEEIRDNIFEPFFTTKPTGEGNTGLGLSISYDIITKGHGGTLTVESELGNGAAFKITLPG